jgi:hypothetical protein
MTACFDSRQSRSGPPALSMTTFSLGSINIDNVHPAARPSGAGEIASNAG